MILLLILFNGVLAMSELALVSARKARLKQRADRGDKGARVALELARDPSRLLSTVQIGITLVGILAGAFGGATLAEELAPWFTRLPWIGEYGEAVAVVVVVMVITYLSLIVGELVPKQLALQRPEALASLLARPLRILSRISAPAVYLLDLSSRLVLRLLGSRPSTEPPVTEEEIRILLDLGTRAGVFEKGERDIVARALVLGERRVGELVTHRRDVVALNVADPPEINLRKMLESGYFFFPVYEGTPDRVLGIVSVRDLWTRCVEGEREPDLRSLLLEPLYLPEHASVLKAVERFRQTGGHLALVLDEYGGIEGLVTLNDVLEALVGDLPTLEEPEPMFLQREDGSWLLDGTLPALDMARLLRLGPAEAEDLDDYQTVGGFVMGRLGRIPQTGDRFEWRGLRFEVLDMDDRRVDKVLVQRIEPPAG
ncbi:MAG TPA: hemolysin family protein [Thermoanaerobaculia bacterium]|nr:hemolysin family protein [Thermoanaerobaculia bacterium]